MAYRLAQADTGEIRAGIYCRQSRAEWGDTTKVEDQALISRELCGKRGWPVAVGVGHPEHNGVYTDNSRSAWQRNRKRPAWDQMLADVDAGKINAIVIYHGDRLVRQPFDLELLINLAYGKGIRLASPTGDRDLSNDDDLFILRIEVAAQCRESGATSRRKKNQYRKWAQEGRVRPGGPAGRPFGWARGGIELRPADRCELPSGAEMSEAVVLNEAAARILVGESTYAVATDLTRRGWRTVTGRAVTQMALKEMLRRPRNVALMPDSKSPAAWEPLMERDIWEQVCAVLTSRSAGYQGHTNARKYLLSGIAECGKCETPMECHYSRRIIAQGIEASLGYTCVKAGCRKVHRLMAHVDAYVIGRVLAYLSGDELRQELQVPADPKLAEEIVALERRRELTRGKLAALADSPDLDPVLAMQALASFDTRIGELRARAATTARRHLLNNHAGLTLEQWEKLPLGTRRALVSASYRVVILPVLRRGPGFDPSRIRLIPVQEAA